MNNVVDLYRIELPRHISRWHYPYSVDAWEDDIANRLLTFLLNRPCNLATEVMKYFDLSFLLAGVYYLNYSSINFPSYSNPPLSVVKPIVIY